MQHGKQRSKKTLGSDNTHVAPVYLLAGGKSSRFGSDKARAEVAGEPLLLRVLRSLGTFPSFVCVVARERGDYDDLGVETIADRLDGLGPLGGLHSALYDLKQRLPLSAQEGEVGIEDEGWLLLMPCDLLGVQEAWIRSLWSSRRKGDQAIAFLGEHWEPLCALYHVRALPLVEAQIARGQGALWRLLESASARSVPLPKGWASAVVQANTPQALAAYLGALEGAEEAKLESSS